MLIIALALTAGLRPVPTDTSAIDIQAAARAVLDSGTVWAGDLVGRATRVVIDRGSFDGAARGAGVSVTHAMEPAETVRHGAVYMAFDSVTQCAGMVQSRCTLPAGTIVVQATQVRVTGERTTVLVTLRWPYRGGMGFVEYGVTFVDGAVVSVRQVRRS